MAIKFTVKSVASLTVPREGYKLYFDKKTPGLGVRVTSNGHRSYIFESRVNGRTLRTTIGDTTVWKLGAAQAEARRLASECVDRGIDPRVVADAQRAQADADRIEAQRREHVFAAVWNDYVADSKAGWGDRHYRDHIEVMHPGGVRLKQSKKGTKGVYGLSIPGPLAALAPLKLTELTPDTVATWLKHEARTRPTSASKAFRLLRAFIGWANDYKRPGSAHYEYRGTIAPDACTARDVRKAVPKPKSKTDCLQKEQLPLWFKAVAALPNPVISAYLQTLMLTGPRREELATLRWTDVDFTWNSITIRDKVEGERTIPLTPYVSSLLAALPRRNVWVFSSETAEGGRLVEPTKAHNDALAAVKLPALTLHGLRRSFSTLSEWVEMPTGVVAQIQGHKPSATAEKHYKVRPLDLLRKWHTTLEAWILEEAGVVQPGGDKAAA